MNRQLIKAKRGQWIPVGLSAAIVALSLLLAIPSLATAGPRWTVVSQAKTSVPSGENITYHVRPQNKGDAAINGAVKPVVFEGVLPTGLSIVSFESVLREGWECPELVPGAQTFTCINSTNIYPAAKDDVGFSDDNINIVVAVAEGVADPSALTARFALSGGGAPDISVLDPTTITSAPPQFDINAFDTSIRRTDGTAFSQAGGHPDEIVTPLDFNTFTNQSPVKGDLWPVEPIKDVLVDLPAGLVGNPTAAETCATRQLINGVGVSARPLCPVGSQVGTMLFKMGEQRGFVIGPYSIYNMIPAVGEPARFGLLVGGTVVTLQAELRPENDYRLSIIASNIPQGLALNGSVAAFWNDPSDASHDVERACPGMLPPSEQANTCAGVSPKGPFLRLPTNCAAPLPFDASADSWWHPGSFDENGAPDLSDPAWRSESILSHGLPGYPADPQDPETPWGSPQALVGCAEVPVKGTLSATPTALDTETSSGLDVHVEVPNPGLENLDGIASSDIKAVKVTLPEGVTVNPSQAEGLGACSPAQYASTELSFHPDGTTGCPSNSKIGTVSVKTPLLEETIPGDVYIAEPNNNPFDSLLALYVVMQEPQRGIQIKLAGEVETDPVTGQITTSFEDLPQLPFSTLDFKFREGARAPLVTPAACGTYETVAEFTGYSDPANPIISRSGFQITRGIGGGPCPSGGTPPFRPGLIAGSRNNNAGSFSPFDLRLFRSDGEQEITHFSVKLPPGLSGKLAGVPFCPDAAIAAAKDPDRSGAAELASPSCPAASQVGRTLVGAGVGSVLTYVPGKIYLAGPYHGSALSIAAITAAKVGPFDLGTVVVREALKINPETAEVFIDATGSDPIPHIIDGITVHLRDIRAYVERPEFTLNPTSCDATSVASTVLGSGLDFTSAADDQPITVSTRYQAANCAALGFRPKLALRLFGGTRRGDNPKLRAVLTARKGDANIGQARVTLPHSEFLDQSHIRTVCTRVQFKEGAVPGEKCPRGSVYGHARAITPLLDEPLQGPVFLRSSSHQLPDLVAALHSGRIDINLAGRIDSVKGGLIRTSFEAVPDAPVTKFTLTMQGGKKGLLVNSTNLCARKNRAIAAFTGHNGKAHDFRPLLRVRCGKSAKKKR
jgi:uncharacterized repeat protein (TIGR01451 family)